MSENVYRSGGDNPFAAPNPRQPGYWTGPLPPRRKPPMAGWKLGLLIIGGIVLAFGLLVIVFALLFHFGKQDQPVRAGDRAVLLTADKVKKHFALEIDKRHEKFKKVKNFDNSYELTYEYDLPDGIDGKGASALVIQCNLTVHRNRQDAMAGYHGNLLGQKAIFDKEKMREEVNNDLFRWGDASRFSLVYQGGEVVLYTFGARQGAKVWSVLIAGVTLDTSELIKKLLDDVLTAVETYTP